MTENAIRPVHAKMLTDFDRQHFGDYLFVLDAVAAGFGWKHIASELWGPTPPLKAKSIVQDYLRRARWMTTTGYKLLLAESETPHAQALDELVADGAMSSRERAFLDSPGGEQYWPRAKH